MRLRGYVDSLDDLGGVYLLTDYKRHSTPSKSDVKVGRSPQLLLYANALAHLPMVRQIFLRHGETPYPLARLIVGYWSIIKGEWIGIAAGRDAKAMAQELGLLPKRSKESLEEFTDNLTAIWSWRHAQLFEQAGDFRPDPSECGYCAFAGVCRRDDPELAPAVKAGEVLRAYLAAAKEG